MATRILVHPITGDRVTVLVDAAESAGDLFRFEYDARTPTSPAEDHAHPEEERVEVIAGTLYCRVDGEVRRLVAGESLVFPPWQVHALWHGEPGVSRSTGEFKPGARMEELFGAVFGASIDAPTVERE